MKQTFYIPAVALGLLTCNAQPEIAADNTSISETADSSVSSDPQPFHLTDTIGQFNPGDYYVSTDITYHFSGVGDENSMDETPYLDESSEPILDSMVVFLNANGTVGVSIFFVTEGAGPTYDSCVGCAFVETIKNYLVSKGIKEDRIEGSYNVSDSGSQDNKLNKIRNVQAMLTSLDKVVLIID